MIKIIVSWALWHNLKQLLIAVDQLFMVLYGIIISFFANIFRRLVDVIFFIPNGFNFNHCQDSYTSEMTRAHLPPDFRK